MNITEKLSVIQQELIAPKNQYNSFGKYNYRSCEDILESLKPYLNKLKVAVTVSDDIIAVGDRYYVKATATIRDCESNETITNSAYARESDDKKGMDASQVTGATSSYARKYALNGLFCIDDVKDADTRDNRQQEAKEQKQAEEDVKKIENLKISDIKVKVLQERCEKEGVSVEKILKLYKVESLADITEKQFRNINDFWAKIKGE